LLVDGSTGSHIAADRASLRFVIQKQSSAGGQPGSPAAISLIKQNEVLKKII
jgi:hypothetical protein